MKNKITEKLFELAYTDSMTEVQNRNAYEERLKKLRKPNANISRITVIVIDINGLKEINDGFGHFCGDDAIKTVAKALSETIGAKADIYRIGGDEFVCISESNILPYISQFRDTISFLNNEKLYKLSVSVGYAPYNEKYSKTIDDMIRYADEKMYKDKKRKNDIDYSEHSFAIHYIDVGQGDAALVVCDDKTMLIDGGKPSASSIIYTYLKNLNIDYLDYIVASHADDDHIGGLSAPLAKMKVGNVIAPEIEADTRSYNSLKTKTEEQGLTIQHPKPGDSIDLGSSKIEFYGPITESESDRNNGSIVMKIIYGDTSFLFTGDAEREEEQEILNAGYDLSATVLKVGHHGSNNSTTYPFLREIMPQYAVISVGDNSYGHPTEDTLSRLRDADVKVYRTDMQGDIIATSDGKTVTITTKKNADAETNPTVAEKSNAYYQTEEQNTNTDKTEKVCEYIGNRNTKKFHYPECSSVGRMKEKNKVYLNCTRDEAIADGYESCGRCNP